MKPFNIGLKLGQKPKLLLIIPMIGVVFTWNFLSGALDLSILGINTETNVTKVIDGDTLKVLIDNREATIRLVGINTPETNNNTGKPECFANQAKNKLSELVTGKQVSLVSDSQAGDKDRYGRLLRYVYVDNLLVNQVLVAEGYAHVYDKTTSDYLEKFQELELLAKKHDKGIWGSCR